MGTGSTVNTWPWSFPVRHAAEPFPSSDALRELGTLGTPGGGSTPLRFARLAEIAARDLVDARLSEGHADALAILAEANVPAPAGPLAVWAAAPSRLRAERQGSGWHLSGAKPWCSGAHLAEHALVAAGSRLFVIATAESVVSVEALTWSAVGMAGSDTADVVIDGQVAAQALIGAPGWYTGRPGFWFGSMGVAACWVGGAVGAVRSAAAHLSTAGRADPHRLAALGAAAARCDMMAAAVERAGRWVDAHPCEAGTTARATALGLRQGCEDACLAVIVDAARASGADHVTHDAAQAHRLADLPVYVRQHHGGADAAEYGCALLEAGLIDP